MYAYHGSTLLGQITAGISDSQAAGDNIDITLSNGIPSDMAAEYTIKIQETGGAYSSNFYEASLREAASKDDATLKITITVVV